MLTDNILMALFLTLHFLIIDNKKEIAIYGGYAEIRTWDPIIMSDVL